VSAFIAAGPPSRVIEETIDGRFELILAQPVMVELERILTGKLGFDQERWSQVRDLLIDAAIELVSSPDSTPNSISGDPDDDLILTCAVEAAVDVLVSGDRKHLLPIGNYGGVRIATPQALLAELHPGG
jgi:uncharacterized protein